MTKPKTDPTQSAANPAAVTKPTPPGTSAEPEITSDPPVYRSNPEVDARIDRYIRDNPRHWAYIQSMPRDRLERSVVLAEVRQLERQERIRDGVLKKLDRDPELKRTLDRLVQDLPEGQREDALVRLARQHERVVGGAHQGQGVKV